MRNLLQRIGMRRYDPTSYWNSRQNPNNAEGNAEDRVAFDIKYIAKTVRASDTVLELGPGIGRTLAAYTPGKLITTLDLSRKYSVDLERRASGLGLTLRQHYLARPDDPFPFGDRSFQVGVVSQVLLHVPPEFLRNTLSELVRTCEELTVITAYRHGAPTVNPRVKHVFNHDYFSIITELGCEMNELIENEGRLCFRVSPRG